MNAMKWLCGLAFTVLCSVTAHAQQISGIMMVVKGDIKVMSAGKTEAAKVGKKVSSGDTIIAGADSRAKIVMTDKNVINVSPDSKIVIEKYENDGKDKKNVELNVVYGKVRASVEQKYDGEKNKFNIKTPSAVAGVRGTDFIMGYNTLTRTAQVITFSGSVAVGTPGAGGAIQNPVFVNPGQMTTVGPSNTPEAPKAVPKEELNKMNNETKADTASNPKPDPREPASENQDKKDKKDDKKDDKKEDRGDKREDPRKREPNSEPKKDELSPPPPPPPPLPPPPPPSMTVPPPPPTVPTMPTTVTLPSKARVIITIAPQ